MFKALKIKNLKFKIILVFLISLIFNLNSVPANASSFNNSYLRLNNLSSSSPLSGTICANPSAAGAGTEAKVTISFPTDFTISQTASSWTTTTTNLPQGATAWPSIGAVAASVSGRSVTFSNGDLTSSTLYCFNFTGASSTTGNAGNDKDGIIATKNNSDTIIDSDTYALSIVNNNQITITASVDPQVSELPIAIESTTPGTQFPQNTTISYKITYGSSATTPIPLTIQAQWSQGTIQGSPTPSVDILDYVVGSASNAYSSTPPVVDTVNRTITWTITSFPGATTGQIVTFSLRTNSSYAGPGIVDFTVSARAISGSTVTPDEEVNQSYLFVSGASNPNPGGPGDGRSDGRSDSRSGSQPSDSFLFNSIEIISISKSDAKIFISTNRNAALTVQYGKSITSLSKSVKTTTLLRENIITLSDLEPGTSYYFKVIARDANGNIITSDIFTFKTAVISTAPTVDLQSLIVTSNNIVLLNPQAQIATGQTPKHTFALPISTVFEVHFALNNRAVIKSVQIIIKNKNVLGVNTFENQDAGSNLVNLAETRPGTYTGKVLSPRISGNYELYVRIVDYNGNITLEKIAEVRTVNNFKVLDSNTKNPIENSRVLFYLYNPTSKIYETISPQILPIDNPSYSSPDGTINVVFPNGKYKAEVSAIGYKPTTTEFEIAFEKGNYPTIYLIKEPFNIINTITYYFNTFSDNLNEAINYIRFRADSSRLFDLITTGTLFIFVITTLFVFSARTHISFLYLPYFLVYKTDILLKKDKSSIFLGKVVEDTTKNPVSRAIVSLIDSGNNTIATLKTNKLGEFYYPNVNLGDYKISVTKKGFKSSQLLTYKEENKIMPLTILIKKDESALEKEVDVLLIYAVDFVGLLFEFMLAIGIIIEIFFIFTFGFLRIAPFMTISIANLLLLFLFLHRPRNLES